MYYCFKTLAAVCLMAASACTTPNLQPAPRQVFVMRHLQAGSGADPGLTVQGSAEARQLAGWFRKGDKPRAIYVSRFRRTQETAAPLAAEAGMQAKVYDPADTPALIEAVKREQGNVLVVGHSNTVPDIVEQLGGTRPEPIAHDRHGDIWRVSGPTGKTERLHLQPHLAL